MCDRANIKGRHHPRDPRRAGVCRIVYLASLGSQQSCRGGSGRSTVQFERKAPRPTPARAAAFRDVEAATLARDGSPPITRTTFPTCRAHYPGGSSGCGGFGGNEPLGGATKKPDNVADSSSASTSSNFFGGPSRVL